MIYTVKESIVESRLREVDDNERKAASVAKSSCLTVYLRSVTECSAGNIFPRMDEVKGQN